VSTRWFLYILILMYMFTDFNETYVAFKKKDHKCTPILIYQYKASTEHIWQLNTYHHQHNVVFGSSTLTIISTMLYLAAQKTMLHEEYLEDHEDYMSILYVTNKNIRTGLRE